MTDRKILGTAVGVVVASLLMCALGIWRIHENRVDCSGTKTLDSKLSDVEKVARDNYYKDLYNTGEVHMSDEQFKEKYNSTRYERLQAGGSFASLECSNLVGLK